MFHVHALHCFTQVYGIKSTSPDTLKFHTVNLASFPRRPSPAPGMRLLLTNNLAGGRSDLIGLPPQVN